MEVPIEIKEFTIEDISNICLVNGISCKNCLSFNKTEFLEDYGICRKNGHHSSIVENRCEYKDHFCADFKQKDK